MLHFAAFAGVSCSFLGSFSFSVPSLLLYPHPGSLSLRHALHRNRLQCRCNASALAAKYHVLCKDEVRLLRTRYSVLDRPSQSRYYGSRDTLLTLAVASLLFSLFPGSSPQRSPTWTAGTSRVQRRKGGKRTQTSQHDHDQAQAPGPLPAPCLGTPLRGNYHPSPASSPDPRPEVQDLVFGAGQMHFVLRTTHFVYMYSTPCLVLVSLSVL